MNENDIARLKEHGDARVLALIEETERHVRWALRLSLALAKRCLKDEQNEDEAGRFPFRIICDILDHPYEETFRTICDILDYPYEETMVWLKMEHGTIVDPAITGPRKVWPGDQEWKDLAASSQTIFLKKALAEAGVPEEEYLEVVRSGRYDFTAEFEEFEKP